MAISRGDCVVLSSSCKVILQKLDKPLEQISKEDIDQTLHEVKAMLRALDKFMSS